MTSNRYSTVLLIVVFMYDLWTCLTLLHTRLQTGILLRCWNGLISPVYFSPKSRCLANSLIQLPLSFSLGARGFSCAVSGFGQVSKSDPREKLRARVFGLRPNTCRPAADETNLSVAHERKPLVPRVLIFQLVALTTLPVHSYQYQDQWVLH